MRNILLSLSMILFLGVSVDAAVINEQELGFEVEYSPKRGNIAPWSVSMPLQFEFKEHNVADDALKASKVGIKSSFEVFDTKDGKHTGNETIDITMPEKYNLEDDSKLLIGISNGEEFLKDDESFNKITLSNKDNLHTKEYYASVRENEHLIKENKTKESNVTFMFSKTSSK